MPRIHEPIESSFLDDYRIITIRVDRFDLQKRRWRKSAEDGADFAFDLDHPLADGDFVWRDEEQKAVYQVCQQPEPVLRVTLPGSPHAAARLAWNLGNLHQPVDIHEDHLLVEGDPAVLAKLRELGVEAEPVEAVFSPPAHSQSHGHGHSHSHEPAHTHEHRH